MKNIEEYKQKLRTVGDSIRRKTGKEDKLTLEQMATEIEGIEVGGSNADYVALIDDSIVNFKTNGATNIKQYLFKDSKTIKTADFEGVKSIGAEAFANSSLETITNADDLTSIKGSAFHSSAIVEFKSNMDFNITSSSTRVFYGCKNLKTFFAPQFNLWNTLYIFQNCTALEKVVVQAGQIGTSNFSGCTSLTALVIHQYQNSIATLSGGVNALSDTPIANGTGYIYVPKALIEQYKVATNWINFADQFRAIEDYPEICGGGTQ